jgi:hypothetical protein
VIAFGKEEEARLKKMEKELTEIKKKLDQEHEQIMKAEERLKKWTGHSTYDRKKNDLINWTKEYDRRKKAYAQRLETYENLKRNVSFPHNLRIFLVDDTELPVSVIATSYCCDLALLRLEGYKTPFIEPADVEELSHGKALYAIGSPVGLSLKHTVTSGIFSGFREFEEGPFEGSQYLQTNAQINKGNSGGPLVTEDGRVVGINTWKVLGQEVEGLGFAIPISIALDEFGTYLKGRDEPE